MKMQNWVKHLTSTALALALGFASAALPAAAAQSKPAGKTTANRIVYCESLT